MTYQNQNRQKIIQSFKKVLSDKHTVSQYLKGNITQHELKSKGIKLGRPI